MGVPVFRVDNDPRSPALSSRYLRKAYLRAFQEDEPREYLDFILGLGRQFSGPAVLIPTSDELAELVAENREELSRSFLFPQVDVETVRGLASKKDMHGIAREHGIPTPKTLFPTREEDVLVFRKEVTFPVMLKAIHGNRLEARTGLKMVRVNSEDELLESYRALEDADSPNLMIQEYIPGGDDQVYIFNGYFDAQSECQAGFTGRKIRQYPVHVGAASLGLCAWYEDVARMTTRFMKELSYQGILDIGYRLDPRDGQYKVLDINPRVGQAFRLFVAENDLDVIRALYLDLTRQEIPPAVPREGRRWLIEDYDVLASIDYQKEGTLAVREWARSFRGVEEAAWFCWKDPIPFLLQFGRFLGRAGRWALKRAGIRREQLRLSGSDGSMEGAPSVPSRGEVGEEEGAPK